MTNDEIHTICKLGFQLYTRDRYDDAARIFRGLVSLDDSLEYPWHALGLIARKRGEFQRAVDCFQRRLEIAPDADDSRVGLAETLWEHGYRGDAIDVLRRLAPDSESEAARRGRVLLARWTRS